MWRLGMQCEGLVRDPIRLAALVLMNQAGWPSSLGMEAEALREPYGDASVTDGRREKNGGGNAPTSGNQHGERPTGLRVLRPFPFPVSSAGALGRMPVRGNVPLERMVAGGGLR
jgi:hypothetical protein